MVRCRDVSAVGYIVWGLAFSLMHVSIGLELG